MRIVTLFEEIASQLLQKIESGQYTAGSELPNEGQLQRDYEVSRTTVRKAIDLLVGQNKVVRKKGVGLFVAPSLSTQNILEMTGVIKPSIYQNNKQIIKESYLRQAGIYYGKMLNMKSAELIYYISYLVMSPNQIVKEVLLLPLDNFPDFQLSSLKILSVLEIANSGKKYVNDLEQDLRLIRANSELAKQLQINMKEPVFKVSNHYFDENKAPIAIEYKFANNTRYVVDFA